MHIKLTANAGVLIELDGVRILLDGVCEPSEYYLGTPTEIRAELSTHFPDAVGFTHTHSDHYDVDYVNLYKVKTLRPVLGSECSYFKVGNIELRTLDTRHLGRTDVSHKSFIIEGSRRIFFMGDAAPSELCKFNKLGIPDVIIAPFAYFNTAASLKKTAAMGARELVLVHMPSKDNDSFGIWKSVENSIKSENVRYFTKIGESITLQ